MDALVEKIKAAGKGRKYDALIGVSGGCDSSYLLHVPDLRIYGLQSPGGPLRQHLEQARSPRRTSHKVTRALDIDLYTHVVDDPGVRRPSTCRSCARGIMRRRDPHRHRALAATMGLVAEKHKIKIPHRRPLVPHRWLLTHGLYLPHWDARYVKSVHDRYGTRSVKSFPNLWLHRQLRWMLLRNLKTVRPLYHMDYDKEAAKKLLTELYDWYLVRRSPPREPDKTTFYHSYLLPTRWMTWTCGSSATRPRCATDASARLRGARAHGAAAARGGRPPLLLQEAPPANTDEDLAGLVRLPFRYYTDLSRRTRRSSSGCAPSST